MTVYLSIYLSLSLSLYIYIYNTTCILLQDQCSLHELTLCRWLDLASTNFLYVLLDFCWMVMLQLPTFSAIHCILTLVFILNIHISHLLIIGMNTDSGYLSCAHVYLFIIIQYQNSLLYDTFTWTGGFSCIFILFCFWVCVFGDRDDIVMCFTFLGTTC